MRSYMSLRVFVVAAVALPIFLASLANFSNASPVNTSPGSSPLRRPESNGALARMKSFLRPTQPTTPRTEVCMFYLSADKAANYKDKKPFVIEAHGREPRVSPFKPEERLLCTFGKAEKSMHRQENDWKCTIEVDDSNFKQSSKDYTYARANEVDQSTTAFSMTGGRIHVYFQYASFTDTSTSSLQIQVQCKPVNPATPDFPIPPFLDWNIKHWPRDSEGKLRSDLGNEGDWDPSELP
ncbi:hypothetical protein EV361DRAFT_593970 [Lentinula raphanica]|nr:hypothetical protein EV361DRAFT_593970 [Lentinula raphanica]